MNVITLIVLLITSLMVAFVKIDTTMIVMRQNNVMGNKRFWFSVMLVGLYILISYLITDNAIKVILEFTFLTLGCWIVFNFKQKYLMGTIIMTFVMWVLMLLIDVVFSIIWVYVLKIDMNVVNNNAFLKFFISFASCFFLVLMFVNDRFRNFFYKIIKTTNSFTHSCYIIIVITLSVLMFSLSVYICLFNHNVAFILVTLFLMIVIYTVVVIVTINEFHQKNRIQSEYDILAKNLTEYENLLDIQRVSNHENKNQLLVIRGMIEKGEYNVDKYIDSIIDNQYRDNELIIMKTNRIPSGGLRGLIYYKILTMKDKGIESNLDVDRSLGDLDFDSIPIKTNQELCKIIGVFLDNAIQAVSNLKSKNINILLKFDNNELIIKICNNYSGIIELDKIDNKGYTTKGKGHGYGLSLVKSIIENNDRFVNEREFNGKLFSQIIRLKI